MKDFSSQADRPVIGIYDDNLRQLTIHMMESLEELGDDPKPIGKIHSNS